MKSHYATLVVRPKHSEEMINNVHLIKANDSIMILVIIYNLVMLSIFQFCT